MSRTHAGLPVRRPFGSPRSSGGADCKLLFKLAAPWHLGDRHMTNNPTHVYDRKEDQGNKRDTERDDYNSAAEGATKFNVACDNVIEPVNSNEYEETLLIQAGEARPRK